MAKSKAKRKAFLTGSQAATIESPKRKSTPKKSKVRVEAPAAPDPFTPVASAEQFAPNPVEVAAEQVATSTNGSSTITLSKRLTEKGGLTSYSRPGVRASVYFSKGLFKDGALPETVTLIGPNFAEPGAIKPGVNIAAKAAKAEAAATKAAERAKKAAERAAKAQAAAAKFAVPASA